MKYTPGRKLFPKPITIRRYGGGYGYHYDGVCFAYVWACMPFSTMWWRNLAITADCSTQEILKAGAAISQRRPKSLPEPR